MALCPSVLRASGETATARAGPRSRNPLTSRFRIMRSNRQVQQALSPGLNTGPTSGKAPDGWTSSQGVSIRHTLPVQFGQTSFEIIVHQRDRQVRGTLDDANAELAQGGTERSPTLHIDRLNAHPTISEILLRDPRRQAEARPVAGHGAGGSGRCRNDIAAFDQPLEGFFDLVGRKLPSQIANELRKALSAFSDGGGERAIKLAVKEELPVLGIEADDIGRQHIDREIWRELRNFFAGVSRNSGLCDRPS